MDISELKQIETGHYVVYSVKNVGRVLKDGIFESSYPVAFKDHESADKACKFLTEKYYPYYGIKGRARVEKQICVFDGETLHAFSGLKWPFCDLHVVDRIRSLDDTDVVPFKSPYGRAFLKCINTPLLTKRNFCLDCLCKLTCLCCCFGCYKDV